MAWITASVWEKTLSSVSCGGVGSERLNKEKMQQSLEVYLSLTAFFHFFPPSSPIPPFSGLHRWRCGPGAVGEWHELLYGERSLYTGRHGPPPKQRPFTRRSPAASPPSCALWLPGTQPCSLPSHPASAPFLPLQGKAETLSAHAHPGCQVNIPHQGLCVDLTSVYLTWRKLPFLYLQ